MNTAARQRLHAEDLAWFKSSYSSNEGGNCLEVATLASAIHVRDSKAAPEGPVLAVSPGAWAVFVERVVG